MIVIFSEESVRWGLLLLFSSVLSVYLSAYAFQRRDVPGAREFSFFTLTIALYSLGYALEINARSLEHILDFMRYKVFWASFTAPAFLLFVIRFIRRKKGSPIVILLLFVVPGLIGYISLSDNHMNYLYKSCVLLEGGDFPVVEFESGLWHKIQLLFFIICSLIAELLLLIRLFWMTGRLRMQTFFVFIGGLLPTCSAIANFERSNISHLDTQPYFFFAAVIFLSAALFCFQMPDISRVN